MPACKECGANVALDENFCGSCGARLDLEEPAESSAPQTDLSKSLNVGGSTWQEDAKPASGTGEIEDEPEPGATSRAGAEGPRRSKPKALAGGKVLNNRYEVVRRIGGGGMGAVYLAKDKNLGDAPRAVKEMIESHIDDTQHEKAIADFKRESLLLTELEHPSIPTVYDYFYDDNSERFYLVMKFIPGSDLSSRLRATPAGKLDEPAVTEWGIQIADVLQYLHSRPEPIIYRDLSPPNAWFEGITAAGGWSPFELPVWVIRKRKGQPRSGPLGMRPPRRS